MHVYAARLLNFSTLQMSHRVDDVVDGDFLTPFDLLLLLLLMSRIRRSIFSVSGKTFSAV